MQRRVIALTLPAALALAIVALPSSSTPAAAVETAVSTDAGAIGAHFAQAKGRYKKQGDNCEWDANDGGPNQCEPVIKGRFKKGDKDSCTWDANDVGADQCRPPKGRWKKGGDNSCAWDPNDGGPDQCSPRKAK